MALINVAGQPNDANDGQIGKLDYRVGNRQWGQRAFLSGTEVPIETTRTAGAATLSNVAGSVTSVALITDNQGRRGLIIVNDSAAVLYVKFGPTASTSSFTYKLTAGDTLEVLEGTIYTGDVDGIWDAASGNARVTELT